MRYQMGRHLYSESTLVHIGPYPNLKMAVLDSKFWPYDYY